MSWLSKGKLQSVTPKPSDFSYDECDDYAKEIKSRQAHVVIHQKSKNLNIVDTSLN